MRLRAALSTPLNQFTKQEDLGTQSIRGTTAHGVRETQTIPSGSTGSEVALTSEYWYSDELHMNVMVKHRDPHWERHHDSYSSSAYRSGTVSFSNS